MLHTCKLLCYELKERGSRVRFPAEIENFFLHHCVQNGSGAHSASYPMDIRGCFPGGKAAGVWSWPHTLINLDLIHCTFIYEICNEAAGKIKLFHFPLLCVYAGCLSSPEQVNRVWWNVELRVYTKSYLANLIVVHIDYFPWRLNQNIIDYLKTGSLYIKGTAEP